MLSRFVPRLIVAFALALFVTTIGFAQFRLRPEFPLARGPSCGTCVDPTRR